MSTTKVNHAIYLIREWYFDSFTYILNIFINTENQWTGARKYWFVSLIYASASNSSELMNWQIVLLHSLTNTHFAPVRFCWGGNQNKDFRFGFLFIVNFQLYANKSIRIQLTLSAAWIDIFKQDQCKLEMQTWMINGTACRQIIDYTMRSYKGK